MQEFTRANLKEVRAVIEKHLAEAGKELGITLSIGNISFNPKSFISKMEAVVAESASGETVDKSKVKWESNKWFLPQIGLKEDDYMRSFTIVGSPYKIVEVSPRRWKRPIIAQRYDGKQFVFTANAVLRALGRKEIEMAIPTKFNRYDD